MFYPCHEKATSPAAAAPGREHADRAVELGVKTLVEQVVVIAGSVPTASSPGLDPTD
jgi:hypothetical protein